jgi:hypothetical protein
MRVASCQRQSCLSGLRRNPKIIFRNWRPGMCEFGLDFPVFLGGGVTWQQDVHPLQEDGQRLALFIGLAGMIHPVPARLKQIRAAKDRLRKLNVAACPEPVAAPRRQWSYQAGRCQSRASTFSHPSVMTLSSSAPSASVSILKLRSMTARRSARLASRSR